MAWDGSGNFNRTNGVNTGTEVWQDDKTAGTKIVADRHDTHDQDLSDGIEACLAKNGENAATANLDAGGYKITNAAQGTAATDYVTKNQIAGLVGGGVLDALGVLAPHKNLVIVNNTTNPTYQIDIDADGIALTDATPERLIVSSVDLTVDITVYGVNGLETGSWEAISTWYHLWVISNGTTTAGLISLSATAPAMPSGYTYKGYVGAIYNDSGGDLAVLHQIGNIVASEAATDLSAGTETTYTSITLSVPTTARRVTGDYSATSAAATGCSITLASTTAPLGRAILSMQNATSGSIIISSPFSVPLVEAQTAYYKISAGTTSGSVYTTGWEY